MSKRDARNLSPSQLDELRSRAIALWKMGWSRRATATLLEVHYNSVGRWVAAFDLEGPGAIVSAKRGRKAGGSRSLSAAQELSVQKMITDKTPDQLKMPFALWTRRAVCELVEESFGIPLPERTCGEYLKRWGFTAQRPARRNYEQNPEAVRRWMQEQYPEVAKRAKEQGAEIHWGDETGVRNDCAHGRGFSPKGKTPVTNSSSKRFSMNMISSVTNQGKVRWMIYRNSFNGAVFTATSLSRSRKCAEIDVSTTDLTEGNRRKYEPSGLKDGDEVTVDFFGVTVPDMTATHAITISGGGSFSTGMVANALCTSASISAKVGDLITGNATFRCTPTP